MAHIQLSSGDLTGRHDGLCEFVSRSSRIKLIELILNSGWSISRLAAELGVTRHAVYLWLKRNETHPCNVNLDKLIDLAASVDRTCTIKIILEDIAAFRELFAEKFGNFRS
jgi:transcriptional regulator with XRE-family HTH domain